jgi:hypothetical protein
VLGLERRQERDIGKLRARSQLCACGFIALNKSGPGLNAVTQINPDALKEAALADKERAAGKILGPAMGLPILLKDIIDATPRCTRLRAGNPGDRGKGAAAATLGLKAG